jgi:hypothetical protein
MSTDSNWYYAENDKRIGPISQEQLIGLWNEEAISSETLIWTKGMKEWIPYSESELFPEDDEIPPPLPTSPKEVQKRLPPKQSPNVLELIEHFKEKLKEASSGVFDYDKFKFFPNIPADKLSVASSCSANIIDPKDVLILIDDTLMGNAKKGLVFTKTHIYSNGSAAEDSYCIPISSITSARMDGRHLYLNDKAFYSFSRLSKQGQEAVHKFIQSLMEDPSFPTETYCCTNCGADVSIDDKVCPKCQGDVSTLERGEQSVPKVIESTTNESHKGFIGTVVVILILIVGVILWSNYRNVILDPLITAVNPNGVEIPCGINTNGYQDAFMKTENAKISNLHAFINREKGIVTFCFDFDIYAPTSTDFNYRNFSIRFTAVPS